MWRDGECTCRIPSRPSPLLMWMDSAQPSIPPGRTVGYMMRLITMLESMAVERIGKAGQGSRTGESETLRVGRGHGLTATAATGKAPLLLCDGEEGLQEVRSRLAAGGGGRAAFTLDVRPFVLGIVKTKVHTRPLLAPVAARGRGRGRGWVGRSRGRPW